MFVRVPQNVLFGETFIGMNFGQCLKHFCSNCSHKFQKIEPDCFSPIQTNSVVFSSETQNMIVLFRRATFGQNIWKVFPIKLRPFNKENDIEYVFMVVDNNTKTRIPLNYLSRGTDTFMVIRSSLKILDVSKSQFVDVLDLKEQKWYPAEKIESNPNELKISYCGYSSGYNETVSVCGSRVAPLGWFSSQEKHFTEFVTKKKYLSRLFSQGD